MRCSGRRMVLAAAVLLSAVGSGAGGALANAAGAATTSSQPGTIIAGSTPSGAAGFLGPARLVSVGKVQLAYRQFGKGPNLLVISGFASPMSLWGTQLPSLLSKHYRVTMFDNRGMGYSTDDASQVETIPLLADDAAGLVRALKLGRPTVLGWSMGGQIGLTLAVQHPTLVRRLVVSGADFGGTHAVQPAPSVEAELNSPNTTPAQFLDLLYPATASAAKASFIAQLGQVPQEPVPPAGAIRQGEAEGAWYQYEGTYKNLPKLAIPVVVTNGRLDVINPVANARLLGRRIPHSAVIVFTAAGHAMLFQNAPRFAAIVAG